MSDVPPLLADELGPADAAELAALKRKIQSERGFNCEFYKSKCLHRRIAVRLRACGQNSFAEYATLLDRDAREYDLLMDTLTINVTKFFRNPELWAALNERVVAELFARPRRERRVWSAGSASGEEAYSVSILLREWAERSGRADADSFQIVGTDIDRQSLAAADVAAYPALSLADLTPAQRERWFEPGPPFQLHAEARRGVTFQRRDLISDEPLREQSLILCRNVIIYLDRPVQENLFRRFYDALLPGGFLVLGKVETLFGTARTLFRPIDNRRRIFQKTT